MGRILSFGFFKMIFLSIVIPAYNSEKTITPLLESIRQSKGVDLREVEVVIVDDCSEDDTEEIFNKYYKRYKHYKYYKLTKNHGPAHARNVGVKYTRGKKVLFLDADVILFPDSLKEVINSFKNDPDLFALTGVWDKKQKNNNFFPKFKALRDWSYWINERDPKNYYYLFSTRVAAIDRALFLRLGGFDETYKAALVEDIELTYRIARRYAVVFNPKVIVHHEFEDFWIVAKKYFLRSFYWSRIYRARKKFDPVATTLKEAMTTISAGGVVVLGVVGLVSYLGDLGDLGRVTTIGLGAVGIIHIWGVRKFLWFCFKEEGLVFAVKAFFTGIILYLVILGGAVASFIYNSKIKMQKYNLKLKNNLKFWLFT